MITSLSVGQDLCAVELLTTLTSGSQSQLYRWPSLKEAKSRVDLKNHMCIAAVVQYVALKGKSVAPTPTNRNWSSSLTLNYLIPILVSLSWEQRCQSWPLFKANSSKPIWETVVRQYCQIWLRFQSRSSWSSSKYQNLALSAKFWCFKVQQLWPVISWSSENFNWQTLRKVCWR